MNPNLTKRRAEVERVLQQQVEMRARAIAAAQQAEVNIQQLQGQLALLDDLMAPNGKAPKKAVKKAAKR